MNKTITNNNIAIQVTDATHYYKVYNEDGTIGQAIGIEGVTLTVTKGSFVALVGHNGCGKSTLAKHLNGLLLPTVGKVEVFGLDTSNKDNIFEIRKTVGMVFQNPDNQMVASIVEEDVAFGPENLGVPQKQIVERVNLALEQVGMLDFAKNSPHKLSGGQKQRIAIAGALAIQPQVLVLDESTAMLDPLGRKEVLQVAHQLNKAGMTVVLITHFMEEVLDCDHVVVMSGGHIVKQGAPLDIFADTKLLDEVGLKAPRTIELAQKLKQKGFGVDINTANAVTLANDVASQLSANKNIAGDQSDHKIEQWEDCANNQNISQQDAQIEEESYPQIEEDIAICAQNLSFVYNPKSLFSKQALKDVNLTIQKGEFVAIVGHTGSGKTTFVQHLNGLIRHQSGNLTVLGQNLADKKLDLKKLRGNVGMVFQYPEYQLFADTVLDDVCFGPKNFGVQKEQAVELAKNAIQLVGLDFEQIKSKSPFDLSGGEKRRVALAGVLAMQPQVLVLDEPTAGLDPRGKREILSLVKRLNRENGITVIMVSHDMNEVYENANRVIVFNGGCVQYDLPPRQLFKMEREIVGMNLEIPQMAQFSNQMEQNGIALPDDAITVDEVLAGVVECKGGGVDA